MAIIKVDYGSLQNHPVAEGSFTGTTAEQEIVLGFKPKQVCISRATGGQVQTGIYNEVISTTQYRALPTSSSSYSFVNFGAGFLGFKLTDLGFSIKCTNSSVYTGNYEYFAIG